MQVRSLRAGFDITASWSYVGVAVSICLWFQIFQISPILLFLCHLFLRII